MRGVPRSVPAAGTIVVADHRGSLTTVCPVVTRLVGSPAVGHRAGQDVVTVDIVTSSAHAFAFLIQSA